MPAPSTYSESQLAQYMHDILGETAVVLGLDPTTDDYQESINETLLEMGVSLISEITTVDDIRRLRTLARRNAWKHVVSTTAGNYAFSADGGTYNREQIHAHALNNLALAEADAAEYSDRYRIQIDRIDYKHDPYQYRPEDERTL